VKHITGIELQESLVSMAKRNVLINGFDHLISIVQADLRRLEVAGVDGPMDLVLSNPPYGKLLSGRLNPNSGKAIARHELLATLGDVVRAAAQLLGQKGRLAVIYPARRLSNLLVEVSSRGFAPKRLTLIHSTLDSEASLVHLESVKGGGEELRVNKPFAIYGRGGNYTDEMNAMYGNGPAVSWVDSPDFFAIQGQLLTGEVSIVPDLEVWASLGAFEEPESLRGWLRIPAV
jgi:tRNA1Val (adenine37-N6)-methyltransferase